MWSTCGRREGWGRIKNGRPPKEATAQRRWKPPLKVAAQLLLALDGFEQGLEVAFPEGLGTFALDDFVEDGRTIHDGLGKELEEVAVLVAIDQDAQVAEVVHALVDDAAPVQSVPTNGSPE